MMWGGRFHEALDPDLLSFTSSFGTDRRLLRWDVVASIAHVQMLGATGIITDPDATAIASGLRALLADAASGELKIEGPYEDIHSFVEAALYQRLGPVAGRLHTARSRNDQVATAFRLFVKDQLVDLIALTIDLMKATVARAEATVDVLLPGFTHLQHAQPVRLAHHLLSYVWMLDRDADRMVESYRRADVLPLGSGALAGVSFPIDRQRVADALGFARLSDNSVDATGDRDFAVDAVAAAAQLMIHLSRWSEELVLWASDEFAFIALADRVATGSSLMPQKKNPDPVELIRGRTGRVCGALSALLTMLKGLPAGYSRDLQEDKEIVFEALDLVSASVRAMHTFLKGVTFSAARMGEAAHRGLLTATEIADYLVRKGMPFRDAHEVAGRVVQEALGRGCPLWELPLDVYTKITPLAGADILDAVRPLAAVEAKRVPGGTAKAAVQAQLADAHRQVAGRRAWAEEAARRMQRVAALGDRG
ncbi:MAG: argininosuccinate lyase [Armatimonadetes bacterium 13_1_40CM_64_14]|nr:MAG: argininosuccinate lyase [Armatimonadetes bacterium 13_1_40CM_64_14]